MSSLLEKMGQAAKASANVLRKMSTAQKNAALCAMAAALLAEESAILAANEEDLLSAREMGLSAALLERLKLNAQRVAAMADSIQQITQLPDPIGYVEEMFVSQDGLQIGKQRVPIGVIGIIYESRPNVTADAAALCFKSGNAVILRGGKEALQSNQAIWHALQRGLKATNVPQETIQLITDPNRALVTELLQMNNYIDCLIPRGGASLIQRVVKEATVPVIETGVGNCHLYVDCAADLTMATRILINGKVDRPAVCNALENLIVHEAVAAEFLKVAGAELEKYGVTIKGDAPTCALLPKAIPATAADYDTEFLDLTLAVKVVADYQAAIEHIQKHSTGHSEVIVTNDYQTAQAFLADIDAAAVYVNASSRFTDGERFGLGGEIGISTQKLHARGPMGLKELTSYKYIILGNGQIRGTTGADFSK
ncbi:glutamate-5-semialdehyde dehydrogenase [Enterococcus nangangensis]|uniref:glutamate-5-semialdehyde dehydrogenase n=1 Tax=Enterococcus nangangensis TaxID=2559926 RepID=UPI0010F921D7|nr:glutamate-5-semialdehyde dehydrogenase [Enterococcus nangangensis]